MHIEKMDWKSRRDIARTTNCMEELIVLSNDNSVRVRKEILSRREIPVKVLENMYENSTSSKEKEKIVKCLNKVEANEELRELLLRMYNDKDDSIVINAMNIYREKFKELIGTPNMDLMLQCENRYLVDWVIQFAGYEEAKEISLNPFVNGEIAHYFVKAELTFERSAARLQERLYNVLSHSLIEQRTLEEVYKTSRNERQGDYDYFFLKPKYAISACKFASTELLANLMQEYQEDIIKYYDENYSRSWSYKYFVKFFTEIIKNPNCDEHTFKKAVEISVKKLELSWPNIYVAVRNSRFFSNEILEWALENSTDYVYFKRFLTEE